MDEGWQELFNELEPIFLRERPGIKEFHRETVFDYPDSRIRVYYARPEDVVFMPRDT